MPLNGSVMLGATWRVGGGVCRILTNESVSRIEDYATSSPTIANEHVFPETTLTRQFNFERSLPDWGIVASYIYSVGTRVDYTTDDTNWTRVSVTNHYDTTPVYHGAHGDRANPSRKRLRNQRLWRNVVRRQQSCFYAE
jgi:hypothetical protein